MVIVHNGGHYELVFHSGAWRRSVRIGLRPANLIQPRRASVRATECTFRIAVFCVGREHRRELDTVIFRSGLSNRCQFEEFQTDRGQSDRRSCT